MHRKVTYLFVSLFFLFPTAQVNADSLVAKEFVEKLFTEKPNEVVNTYMRPEVVNLIGISMKSTLSQIAGYAETFGKLHSVETVVEEQVTKHIKRVALVAYLDILPMSVEVYLYRSNGKWWVNSFNLYSDMRFIVRKHYVGE